MKNAFARLFGSIWSGLATGIIVGLAIIIPAATSAAATANLEGSLLGANVTAGDNDYKNSVSASYNQLVKLQVYYRNNTSGIGADSVRVKIAMPNKAGSQQTVSATVKADNSNQVDSSVTVTLEHEDAVLQYVPGTAVWKHNTGSADNPTVVETPISDDVVNSPQGYTVETQQSGDDYASTISVEARVVPPGISLSLETELTSQSNKWSTTATASPGDTLRYIISYQNTSNQTHQKVVLRSQLPDHLQLVPGSTKLYNSSNGNGVAVQSDAISAGGVVIGNYGPGANAYVTFEAKVAAADQLACGSNDFRVLGGMKAQNLAEQYRLATTTVKRDCAAGQSAATGQPIYSCDKLSVTKNGGRAIHATVDYTANNGASFKSITYNFGDGSQPLVTDKKAVDYTFAKDGNYTVTSTVNVVANGAARQATSAACAQTVQFTTSTTSTPTSTPTAGKGLPNSGPGSVIGIFVGASTLGFAGHRLITGRRSSRR